MKKRVNHMFRLRISNAKAVWNSEPKQAGCRVLSLLFLLRKRMRYQPLMEGTTDTPNNATRTPRKGNINGIGTKRDTFIVSDIDAASALNSSWRPGIAKKVQNEKTTTSLEQFALLKGQRFSTQDLLQDFVFHWSTAILYGAKVLISAAFLYYTQIAMSVSIVAIAGILYRNYLSDDTIYDSCPSQIPTIVFVSKRQNSCTVLPTTTFVSDDISLISDTTTYM